MILGNSQNKNIDLGILLILSCISLFTGLGGVIVFSLDEAKNATCAIEMWQNKEYIKPTFNQILRGDKPPLHYFFMILSYNLFGLSEFSARFFSAFFSLCTVLITYFFGSKNFGSKTGFLAAIVLLSSFHFNFQSRLAVPDMYLVFFSTLSIYGLYSFYTQPKTRLLIVSYIAIGLAVLCKGPIAILLPILIFITFLLLKKDLSIQSILKFKLLLGIFIVSLISLPWFILVHLKTGGEFTELFFFRHNINRFTSSLEGHGGTPLNPSLFVLIGLLPFSVFLIQAMVFAWKERKNQVSLLFMFVAGALIVLFFSLSGTQLPNYTVPSYPFFACVISYYLIQKPHAKHLYTGLIVITTLLTVFFVIFYFFPLNYLKAFYQPSIVLWLLIPIAGNILCLAAFYLQKTTLGISLLSSTWIGFSILIFAWFLPHYQKGNSIEMCLKELPKNRDLNYFGSYNPSISFYFRGKVNETFTTDRVISYFHNEQQTPLISRKKHWKEMDTVGLYVTHQSQDLFESPENATILIKPKKVPYNLAYYQFTKEFPFLTVNPINKLTRPAKIDAVFEYKSHIATKVLLVLDAKAKNKKEENIWLAESIHIQPSSNWKSQNLSLILSEKNIDFEAYDLQLYFWLPELDETDTMEIKKARAEIF